MMLQVFADCDRDSLIYLGDPIGPSCHTGARSVFECSQNACAVCAYKIRCMHLRCHPTQINQSLTHCPRPLCRTCWFSEASVGDQGVQEVGDHTHHADHGPATTLLSLERTIAKRREEMQQPTGGNRIEQNRACLYVYSLCLNQAQPTAARLQKCAVHPSPAQP